MSDERRRAAERRTQQTGALEDAVRALQARLRAGAVDRTQVRLAAYLGDPAATSFLREEQRDPLDVGDLIEGDVLPCPPGFEAWGRAVAHDTLTRVWRAVRTIRERLVQCGYEFRDPRPWARSTGRTTRQHPTDRYERVTGTRLPITFRAWGACCGRVDFMGTHRDWPAPGLSDASPPPCAYTDPLVVQWSPESGLRAWRDWLQMQDEGQDQPEGRVEFAPDPGHKANVSSSGSYNLPLLERLAVDAMVRNDDDREYRRLFLQHVRDSLEWGGFPGFRSVPDAPLEWLRALSAGPEPV